MPMEQSQCGFGAVNRILGAVFPESPDAMEWIDFLMRRAYSLRVAVLRWALFSAFLLLVVGFATAVLVIFRALEVASPTRFGISPSEMASPLLGVVGISAAVGLLSLIAATLFWMLRSAPAPGFDTGTMRVAGASLVVIPLLLYLAQMIAIWHVMER